MKRVKCPKCNHEWETKSELKMVTCPSCLLKIKNTPKNKKLKEMEIEEDARNKHRI